MNRHLTCKMIAAIVMGAFLGIFINYGYAMWGRRGHDAFIAYEEHRFDKYMATPHLSIGIIVISIFVASIFFFFYELMTLWAFRILKAPKSVFTEK
jgi:hypothetical protein